MGYALPPATSPSMYDVIDLKIKMKSNYDDICNLENFETVVKDFKPEVVFHLAAQALVKESYSTPRKTFETNILGTVNLLDVCRNVESVKSIVIATSDKCYENKETGISFKETDRLGGYDPYSSSKACAELAINSYWLSFYKDLLPIKGLASVRAGNVIGGGDWSPDRLVVDAVKSIIKDEPVFIRRPRAVRPWQHVLEALSGYIKIAETLYEFPEKYSRPWNLGPNDDSDKSVESFMTKFTECWGGNSSWNCLRSEKGLFHEATLLKLDIQDAKNKLEWVPKLEFSQAIKMTVDWYKSWDRGCNMDAFTCSQILDYENIL